MIVIITVGSHEVIQSTAEEDPFEPRIILSFVSLCKSNV